ncbi:tail fiber domain-containing protein [Flavobacterium ginsenosidimutans]|uniref:Tail fiber domain-containing protein n=1 Tax=Flavobacterium ginsenosidimutans TaxID=687844 RepID=A0ABZ2Q4P8_9FLAO|nr:tail fiber domain-containing protein [Flavobacterium ginsenosidimutans]KAF2327746.1 hypothetical protein DM444_18230 [Flavobacterium ginsenosidimutans]
MKKIIYMLLLLQGGVMMAQTETVVTVNGKKVQVAPNAGTADNGLTADNGKIQLGGKLNKPTTLTTSSVNTLKIAGLQTGTVADSLLTKDANGVLRQIANTSWSTKGNAGTDVRKHFIGTTDDVDLIFRRNYWFSGRIGTENTSLGQGALEELTDGINNVAMGDFSLTSNKSGSNNTAIGSQALTDNQTGEENTAIGSGALYHNIDGKQNTAIGVSGLHYLIKGDNNIALGYNAGVNYGYNSELTQTSNSIFVGNNVKAKANNSINEIVIGYNATGRGSNTVQIGNSSITSIGGAVNWSIGSDSRLKKDVVTSTYGLNFINKLRPVIYRMKTGTTDLQSGFIAQEVETAAKSIGYEFNGIVKPQSENDFYSLRYSEFVVPLVKAVQEQQQMIESQKADIAELKAQVQALLQAAKK